MKKAGSIRRQLLQVSLLTSGLVALLAVALMALWEVAALRRSIAENLSSLARTTAQNCYAPLAFQNPEDATEVLLSLKGEPHLLAAILYGPEGRVFAQSLAQPRAGPPPPRLEVGTLPSGARFGRGKLEVFEPVRRNGERLGTLYLCSDLGAIRQHMEAFAVIALAIAAGSLLAGVLLSRQVQESITEPLLRLAGTARTITERGDYSVRAEQPGTGELRVVTEAFNRMLGEIQQRDAELRRAGEALTQANAQLERRVQERTAKLQESMGDLEHFSYTITHDMRAPLRAMRSFGQLLAKRCGERLDEACKDFLRRIIDSSERMDHLITDALNYSKLAREELELKPVDVGALLHGMVNSYPEFQPPRAQIELVEPIPRVLGNPAGLTQCFSNLLANAVKFVPPGKQPRIRIWAEQYPAGAGAAPRPLSTSGAAPSGAGAWLLQPGQRPLGPEPATSAPSESTTYSLVRIWVEDNGVGIAPEYRERIFQMFQRLDPTREGTGIGLALVRKVVERMQGKVGVESEVGKGSQFWVELRAAEGEPGR